MDIGIGLPNPIPGTPGGVLVEWARRAEVRGFSTLATIDRIAYPSYESMVALAAAAGATDRIRLMTNVLLGPTRNPVLLAKVAASVDQLSGGRLVLGAGVGAREDDFLASGQDLRSRGRRWDEALETMHRAWRGELVSGARKPVCPRPTNGSAVPMIIGGTSDAAVARTIRWGIGWTSGGGGAERAAPLVERIRDAWKQGGRDGQPRIVGLSYFVLGNGGADAARRYLGDYYGDFGLQFADMIPKSPEALQATIRTYADHGYDELVLDPVVADVTQLEQAADAVL
jgi:alkanesulfonate monooxygenase SsuD/methylene tetrahydromethanopterin reductase-like flavin-dependent oxidoreductase (luciferase family)